MKEYSRFDTFLANIPYSVMTGLGAVMIGLSFNWHLAAIAGSIA